MWIISHHIVSATHYSETVFNIDNHWVSSYKSTSSHHARVKLILFLKSGVGGWVGGGGLFAPCVWEGMDCDYKTTVNTTGILFIKKL